MWLLECSEDVARLLPWYYSVIVRLFCNWSFAWVLWVISRVLLYTALVDWQGVAKGLLCCS